MRHRRARRIGTRCGSTPIALIGENVQLDRRDGLEVDRSSTPVGHGYPHPIAIHQQHRVTRPEDSVCHAGQPQSGGQEDLEAVHRAMPSHFLFPRSIRTKFATVLRG